MADNFSDPITIRLAKGHRRKINVLAEKNGTTAAGILRSIVDEYLAGNDLEHRLRIAHEETLNRTIERVVSSVEQGMIFAVEKIASGNRNQEELPRQEEEQPTPQQGRKSYNKTLLALGQYDDEITPAIVAEAKRRAGGSSLDARIRNQGKTPHDFVLEVLNEGWKPERDWDAPMRIPG